MHSYCRVGSAIASSTNRLRRRGRIASSTGRRWYSCKATTRTAEHLSGATTHKADHCDNDHHHHETQEQHTHNGGDNDGHVEERVHCSRECNYNTRTDWTGTSLPCACTPVRDITLNKSTANTDRDATMVKFKYLVVVILELSHGC